MIFAQQALFVWGISR